MLKTGLTGHTVLLPADDAALYEYHVHQFRDRYHPVGDEELALVQPLRIPNGAFSASPVSKWAFTLWAGWN